MLSQKELQRQDGNVKRLVEASLFSLGWIMGKESVHSAPVYSLAKALKDIGVECDYVDSIVKTHEEQRQ